MHWTPKPVPATRRPESATCWNPPSGHFTVSHRWRSIHLIVADLPLVLVCPEEGESKAESFFSFFPANPVTKKNTRSNLLKQFDELPKQFVLVRHFSV
ncbi:hypothetical protein RchiOBHm_Chr2g0094431 [Rosa chinensis]|uniref:Uncharacterized protein n=1 Tax=Rosa chinensis TaxID=74649 RepID=A0A2P6RKH7_ROSCH|nr:hypothetical protein RchiOBHm_Chr2g0094431 [Rosa chinensis]